MVNQEKHPTRLVGELQKLHEHLDSSLEREIASNRAKEFFSEIITVMRDPLVILDSDLRVISANQAFSETFQIAQDNTEHHFFGYSQIAAAL